MPCTLPSKNRAGQPWVKPGHDENFHRYEGASYAVAMSGNTASILVFSVEALNGLTM